MYELCVYVCMNVSMHVSSQAWPSICMCISMHASPCMYVDTHACIHACMYVCVCLNVCIHVCINACTHIHESICMFHVNIHIS